jgi:hypothetical protein
MDRGFIICPSRAGTIRSDRLFIQIRSADMPTAMELRLQAKECLELAKAANEFYIKDALADLARKLCRDARQAERRSRDLRE